MSPVNVLIIEDESEKLERITSEVSNFFQHPNIERSATFAEATQRLLQVKYDLIVVDLLLPRRQGEDPVDISEEIIDHLSESDVNKLTTTVAISRFEEVVDRRRDDFVKAGILLIGYSDDEDWRACLRVCM